MTNNNITVNFDNTKDNFTSLELVDLINKFREQEKNKNKLRHDTMLSIIREEFQEEISLQKILESKYTNERGREYPMFILDLKQSRQVLVKESRVVRKAVIEYIDKLVQVVENQTKQQAKNNVVENENPYLHCSMCQSEKSAWKIKQFDKIKDLAKQYDKSEQDTQKAILCSIYNAMSYKDKIDFDIEQSNYNKAFFTFDKQAKITLIAGNNNLREIFEYRIDKIQDILSDKSKNYSYKVDSCEDMADVQAIIDWLK